MIVSQIGEEEVKQHPKLHLLRIYHIFLQLQHKYLICAKSGSLRNCWTGQKTTGGVWLLFLMGYNPLQQFRFGSNPDAEPNHQFGTVANTTLAASVILLHYRRSLVFVGWRHSRQITNVIWWCCVRPRIHRLASNRMSKQTLLQWACERLTKLSVRT